MMSKWFSKLIQRLDRLVYLASGLLLLVLLYLWSVLNDGVSGHTTVTLMTPAEPLFQFAQHHVYRLESGMLAQVQGNQLGYVFSQQEWYWLNSLLHVSQSLLYVVLVICVWAFRYAPLRRFALSMAIMAGVLLYSRLFGLDDGNKLSPWWTLFLILAPIMSVYFDVRKYLPTATGQRRALIAYASQTGSAKRLAEQLHTAAQSLADLRCVSQLTIEQLHAYQRVFFVVSTHGNGEAPDSAHKLVKALHSTPTRQLDTHFSVLALGDRTYKTFCAFGYQLSDLLDKKGFKRQLPLQEVDRMDIHAVDGWWQQVCHVLGVHSTHISLRYDEFEVVENECLNPSQNKRLAHRIRLHLPATQYQAGDVLAVQPEVDSERVQARLQSLGWTGLEQVTWGGQKRPLLEVLEQLDWEDEHPETPQALVDQLKPVHERLYSIASYEADYVELLVRQHWRRDGSLGIASGYLTGLQPGQRIKASVREHTTFHLHGDVPLIMIGAGTGLAPFIGFLQQKQQWGATTENWLLFGEQYQEHDAYFKDALQSFQDLGILTHYHTAWSRSDGVYVQALLTQHASTLCEWIEQKGAHIYLCGSRQGFGEAVNDTLREIIPEQYLSERLHTDLY